MFRLIRNIIRKPIVDRRIATGRYIPVQNGVNAYYDTKRGGILVKGYYDKPFLLTSQVYKVDEPEFNPVDIQFVNGELKVPPPL